MRRIILPLIIAALGVVGSIVLDTSLADFITNPIVLVTLKIIGIVAAVFPTAYSLILDELRDKESEARYQESEKRYRSAEQRYQEVEIERRKREALDELRDYFRAAIVRLFTGEDNNTIRANIMVVNLQELVILCSINMEFCKDFDIHLQYGQGCAGEAWKRATKKPISECWVPVLAPKTNLSQKDLYEKWHFTDDLIEKTKDVLWVISTPIFYHVDSKMQFIGILNFDGVGSNLKNPKRLEDISLHKDCADIAEEFGKILIHNKIVNLNP
jgi:hypothetical protein